MSPKQIKAKLKKYDISQRQAAEVCGVKPVTVSLVLSGVHKSERLKAKLERLVVLFERKAMNLTTR